MSALPITKYAVARVVTTFRDKNSTSGTRLQIGSWPELIELLTAEQPLYPSKERQPLWKGSTFPNDSRAAGGKPSSHDYVIGDYDAGVMAVTEAREILTQANIACLIYTTASHTPEEPRWRVVVLLKHAANDQTLRLLTGRLNALLRGELARESFDAGRPYFYGRVSGRVFESHWIEGSTWLEDLAHIEPSYPAKAHAIADLPAAITKYDYPPSEKQVTLLGSALDALSSDDEPLWMQVSYALKHLALFPNQEGIAYALWKKWSSKSEKHRDDIDEARWNKLRPTHTHYLNVFRIAITEGGWTGQPEKPFQEVLAYFRTLTPEQLADAWCPITAALEVRYHPQVIEKLPALAGTTADKDRATWGPRTLGVQLKSAIAERDAEAGRRRLAELKQSRLQVEHEPDKSHEQAMRIEHVFIAKPDQRDWYSHGNRRVSVKFADYAKGELDPVVAAAKPQRLILAAHNESTARALVERNVCFTQTSNKGAISVIGVPEQVTNQLLDTHYLDSRAPELRGLMSWPLIDTEGNIVQEHGYNAEHRVYLAWPSTNYRAAESLEEARAMYDNFINRPVFTEFQWKDKNYDNHSAVGFEITLLLKPLLSIFPLTCGNANSPGSGKTTLFRHMHTELTGELTPMHNNVPENQVVHTVSTDMLEGRTACYLDNVISGSTIASAAMAFFSTAEEAIHRAMHRNVNITSSMAMPLIFTGNNLVLGGDIPSRVLHIELLSRFADASANKYKHADVTATARANRFESLRLLVGCMSWWLKNRHAHYSTAEGSRTVQGTRYPQWDELVAGAIKTFADVDITTKFRLNIATASDNEALCNVAAGLTKYCKVIRRDSMGLQAHELATAATTASATAFGSPSGMSWNQDDAESLRNAFVTLGTVKQPGKTITLRDLEITSHKVNAALKLYKDKRFDLHGRGTVYFDHVTGGGGYAYWMVVDQRV